MRWDCLGTCIHNPIAEVVWVILEEIEGHNFLLGFMLPLSVEYNIWIFLSGSLVLQNFSSSGGDEKAGD